MKSRRLFQDSQRTDETLRALVGRALIREGALKPSARISADALRRLATLLGVYVDTAKKSSENSMARSIGREHIEQAVKALRNGVDSVGYLRGSSGYIALLTKKDRKVALKMFRKALKDIS